MDDMPDLEADIATMDIEALLTYQQSLTRARLAINEKARATQEAIDHQAALVAEQRAEEDARFGQVTHAPTQELLG